MSPETRHILDVLKTSMRILGFTNRDIERKLGLSSSYLSRLFSGGIDLKFDHIVTLSRAMGLEPEEVLYFAYPEPKDPPSAAADRIRNLTGGFLPASKERIRPAAPPTPPPPSEDEKMADMLEKTLRKLFGEISRR